jgi:DNA segregation ATPase FtsK/SpoIIIE, S-DNA-T family
LAVKRTQKRIQSNEKGIAKYNHEIIGILLFAFGVLVFLSLYIRNSIGLFGSTIKNLFFGLLGIPSFILPIIIIIYAVFLMFRRDSKKFKLKVLYTVILLVLLASIIHTGNYEAKNYEGVSPYNSLLQFYKDGKILHGGGIIGGLLSTPFLMIFQVLGTLIILLTLSLIDIILLTNTSVANFVRNLRGFFVRSYRSSVDSLEEKRNKKRSEKADTGIDSGVIGDNGDFTLEFKPGHKVIDFKIEKTARELKEKTGSSRDLELEELATTKEPFDLVVEDIQNVTAQEVRKIKERKMPEQKEKEKAVHIEIDSTETFGNVYKYPPLDLLDESNEDLRDHKSQKNTAIEVAKKLEDTLKSFGVEAKVINISRGPAVTRYELQPSPGVKVSKIVNLSDDISLNLAASGVRIEAPIPGKAAIGIEVPNKEVTAVFLRDVIESTNFSKFSSKLAFAVGKDISGESIVADIGKMPHVLIAGATGAGKSVCINSLIISLLYKASPDEVKLLMIDPKVVELGIYNGIPHLLIPVVTEPKKAAGALNWAVQEMVNRYKLFAEKAVRDLKGYNAMVKASGETGILPQIVIIIDELADLMMVAPGDVEDAICRLAQMARAAGMHLVIATQRPSVDVITGIIKANIPSRISFAVSSQIDSRTILDMGGAEKLLGKGDMLFYPVGEAKPIRIKGAFVSEKEVEKVVAYVKALGDAEYDENIIEELNSENEPEDNNPGDNDELLPKAIEMVVEAGQASVSLIQRKFKVGYARAARIVDQMQERGIVGGFEGSKPRQVLISKIQWQEMQTRKAD